MKYLLGLTLALCLTTAVPAGEPGTPAVVRVYYEQIEQIRDLQRFDLLEFNNTEERYVLVLVEADEFDALTETGFPIAFDLDMTAKLNAGPPEIPNQVSGIPGYPCYRTVEEAIALTQQIVLQHPTLATIVDIGDSWDKINGSGGYDLSVLRLTNSEIAGPKPKLFITTSIHAREYPPAGLNARFAEFLVDNYGTDADATWILDYHEVHLMIHANPDARKFAEDGMFWRKNTNQDYCSPTSTNRGADLNRNFEFQWGCCGGASNSQCNELYRGPFAASEPEVQSIQAYLRAEFPDQKGTENDPAPSDATGIYMDIHSAGNLVIWPWGYGGDAPNLPALTTLGRKLAYFNDYEPQQAVDLYPTDGNTIDFGYGDLGVASYAYETGNFFFQDCSTFENVIVPDNLPSFVYAAKVVRTPYLTPAGPEALDVTATPAALPPGGTLDITATLDDTRFNNQNGNEATQNIVAAELYLDLPPWATGSPAPLGMIALDGGFDSSIEQATAVLGTGGLDPGQHIVFVRGQDAAGNWGPFSATFFTISDENGDDDEDGVANGVDCRPLDGSVWAEPSPAYDLLVAAGGANNFSWIAPVQPGSTLMAYDLLRSLDGADFDGATCVDSVTDTMASDAAVPLSGQVLHYLVRSRNRCGGNLGADSSGEPRVGVSCAAP